MCALRPPSAPKLLNGTYQGSGPEWDWVIRVDLPGFPGANTKAPCISGDMFRHNERQPRDWAEYLFSWRSEQPVLAKKERAYQISGPLTHSSGPPENWASLDLTIEAAEPGAKVSLAGHILDATGNISFRFEGFWVRPEFRVLELECDVCRAVFQQPVLPEVPDGNQNISLVTAFARAGVHVDLRLDEIIDHDQPEVPWTPQSLHHLMEAKFQGMAPTPQWKLWGLLASGRYTDPNVAGIMFDTFHTEAPLLPNLHRQGFAIFREHAFFEHLNNMADSAARQQARLRYLHVWTHEAGHAFNLVHPEKNRQKVLSWMNYFNANYFANREAAFWRQFKFSFDAPELRQIRHYPLPKVIMGGADFAGSSAYEQVPNATGAGPLELLLRSKPAFSLFEPVQLELRLRNRSARSVELNVQLHPAYGQVQFFARQCEDTPWRILGAPSCHQAAPELRVLQPRDHAGSGADRYSQLIEIVYHPGSHTGFAFDQPGDYQIQATYTWGNHALVSNIHQVRVQSSGLVELERQFRQPDIALNLGLGGSRLGEKQAAVLEQLQGWEKTLRGTFAGAALARAIAGAVGQSHVEIRGARLQVQRGDPEKALRITAPYVQWYQSVRAHQPHNNLPYGQLIRQRSGYYQEMALHRESVLAQARAEQHQLLLDLKQRGVKENALTIWKTV